MNARTVRTARIAPAVAVLAAAALTLTGCGGSKNDADAKNAPPVSSASPTAQLQVSGAYIPEPTMDMAGAFMVIENNGDLADRLESVKTDIAGKAQLHETTGGKMHEVSGLDIPAHGKLELKHGGNHIMFTGLKKKLKAGDSVTVTLHFKNTPDMKFTIPVKDKTYLPGHKG
ncbi:copper chaperone PCu(A)C [Streptomyces sp. NPDC002537]